MNPEVLYYLKSQVAYLVKNYKLDGVSFSSITYPGSKILDRNEFKDRFNTVKDFLQDG